MQRAVAWSWALLSPAQAALLEALTVFPADFDTDAAAALADASAAEAADLLDALVAGSLLRARAGVDQRTRLSLDPPVREFAQQQLDEATCALVRGRLRARMLAWARALPATPPLDVVRAEMPTLVAALGSAVADGVPQEGVALLLALRRCLEDIELPAQGLAQAQAAAEATADPALRAQAQSLLGPLLFTAGHAAAALASAERGLDGATQDPIDRARALHALARVRWRSRRRADEVEPLLDEAAALAEPGGPAGLRASLKALRAFVTNAHHRDHAAGERLHAQALALWEREGNQHAINSGRYNLAVCAQNASRHRETLQRLAPVIHSARALHDGRRLSQCLNVRGNAHSGLRLWAQAVADYQACIRAAWEGMAFFDLAYGLWNLPRALAHRRQPEAALRLAGFAARFWAHALRRPRRRRPALPAARAAAGGAAAGRCAHRRRVARRRAVVAGRRGGGRAGAVAGPGPGGMRLALA